MWLCWSFVPARASAPRRFSRSLLLIALLGAVALAGTISPGRVPAATAAPTLRFTGGFPWFETGRFPQGLVAADFDGDGLRDLATADLLDEGVSILLAAPDGGFRSRVSYGAGRGPAALVALDADGDGVVDLAVANRDAATVSLLRGRGNGSFALARELSLAGAPAMMQAQDVTGERFVDLVVTTDENGGTLSILDGRGGGMFDPPHPLVTGKRIEAFTTADVLGTGRRALVVATADGAVSVHVSSPGDHWRKTDELVLPGCPSALAAGDLDRDGRIDLAVGACASLSDDSTGAGRILLLRGNGTGRFDRDTEIATDFIVSNLLILDLDRDGLPDLVGADRRRGVMEIFRGDPAGEFPLAGKYRIGAGAGSFVIDDWTRDGRPDLAVLDPNGSAIVLLPGNDEGGFGDRPPGSTDFGPSSIWLGDVNGDGERDLVAVDRPGGRLSVLRGDGTGAFEAQSGANTYTTLPGPSVVAGAILRSGGLVDLVVAHSLHDGFLSVGRNQGDGRFVFASEDTIHTGGRPAAFVLGDVNADGVPDAVVANAGPDVIAVLLTDDAGHFHLARTFPSGGSQPVALALGDVDGDARPDLVVANEATHLIALFHGLGTGEFLPAGQFLTGPRPLSLALADLDQDGHLDLVSGQGDFFPSRGLVAAYLGDGHGAFLPFDPALTARVGYEPVSLVIGDLDREGALDIAVANFASSSVTLLPGLRSDRFTFGAKLSLGTGAGAGTLAAGDVDRDGRTDLVAAGSSAPGVTVLLNRTGDPPAGSLAPIVDIAPGQCPNRWNVQESGFLHAALLGGAVLPGDGAFDPAGVAPDSVRLEGVPAVRASARMRDVGGMAQTGGAPCECTGRAPDGVPDATFAFDARAVAAQLGPVRDGETRVLHFEARLAGGRVITAEDCVVIAAHGPASDQGSPAKVGRPELVGPNPFERGAGTALQFHVPEGGAEVRIGVYSVSGRRVARLAHRFEPAGTHTASWDGRDDDGRLTMPGVYFVRSEVGGIRAALRVVIAR